jgi:hypothetical protein
VADVKDKTLAELRNDPVTMLAAIVETLAGEPFVAPALIDAGRKALHELHRRARVERRLEKWLAGNHCRFAYVGMTAGKLVVSLYRNGRAFEDGNETGQGYESDYWTAADASLTAAGAPKEEG